MKRLMIITLGILGIGTAHATESCVKTTFNVTYSCGDGTLVGTLPADTVANYNKSFTPTTITTSMCTPPDGYEIRGYSIYINDVEMAFSSSFSSFTYSYTTDIEIRPYYAFSSSAIAAPIALATNLYFNGSGYTHDNTTMTWTVTFPYGTVTGIAKCSTVRPENTAYGYLTGLIATDQDAIENDSTAGRYCYCKMTQPEIPGSPWVFYCERSSASDCASRCANTCGSYLNFSTDDGRRFRASVFAAAEQ